MSAKIIVCDMDDTLIDSHLRYDRGVLALLDEAGILYDQRELLATINPLGWSGTAAYFARLGVSGNREEIEQKLMQGLLAYYSHEVEAAPGARAYLEKRKAAGDRLFLLSASPRSIIDISMNRLEMAPLFDKMWCTADFGYTKSQPELYACVTKEIGCRPEDIEFFDDGAAAIGVARQMGWRTCGVCPPYAVESDGMQQVAHRCIVTFEELLYRG